jgi:hypothetical protein
MAGRKTTKNKQTNTNTNKTRICHYTTGFSFSSSSSLLFSVVDVAPEDYAGIRREKTLKRSTPPPHQKPWHDYDKPPTAAKNNNNNVDNNNITSC